MPDASGELTPADVAAFTRGRCAADDPLTATLLAAALADARAYCGWHVTPSRAEVVTLDGPGGELLVLPTLRMSALTAVSEEGSAVDPTGLAWSRRGLVRKASGGLWSDKLGAIVVSFTHGFTLADAAGWQSAVLSCVDRTAQVSDNTPIAVGPFRWSERKSAVGSVFSESERAGLSAFRLERSA